MNDTTNDTVDNVNDDHHRDTSDRVDNVKPIKRPDGNSQAYTLERLSREQPELYGKVKAGELSANAAAIQAGFRKRTVTVPVDPEVAVRALAKHFTLEQTRELAGRAAARLEIDELVELCWSICQTADPIDRGILADAWAFWTNRDKG